MGRFALEMPSDDEILEYAKRTGRPVEEIREWMEDAHAESWSDDQAMIDLEEGKQVGLKNG